jgi:hypothetical protein
MKNLALVLLVAGGLVVPRVAVAKGSGGHGGGHAGGHASGSHGSSGRSSSHASPSSSRSTPSTHGTATPRGASGGSTAAAAGANAAPSLPADRARNGRPSTGTAVPRLNPTSPLFLSSRYPSRIFVTTGFRSFGLYGLYFDPLFLGSYGYPMYGYGDPMYGYGYGNQYGYAPGSYYGYAPYAADLAGPTGGLRLKIEPKDAEVFVDGSYAGIVDDFDGVFQHLTLAAGPHHIEVRSTGYRPLEFDVMTEPHKTTTIRDLLIR